LSWQRTTSPDAGSITTRSMSVAVRPACRIVMLFRNSSVGKASFKIRLVASLRSEDRTFTGHRRTAHTPEVTKKVKPGGVEVIGRHARLRWDGQCPTLRAGTGNDRGSFQSVRPIHPDEPRVITVREGARLQGFPDDFRFHPTVWHSFRMIGNSVSPVMSKVIFSLISERIENRRRFQIAAE
jgi:DNA (cytosine-5)-methyltransferase 1